MYKKYLKYLRHIILPEVGLLGQDLLINSKILCIGAGGLGSSVLIYLSASGVKNLGIIDFDIVSCTNLNRQIIYSSLDIGKKKVNCAYKYLKNLNSSVNLFIYDFKLNKNNCFNLFKNYDLILDCTDNLESKFLINDISIKLKKPFIHASVFGLEGYLISFLDSKSCYRCLHNDYSDLLCYSYGIIGPVAGIIGSLQSLIAIFILLKKNNLYFFNEFNSKLYFFNFKCFSLNNYTVKKNIHCTVCL